MTIIAVWLDYNYRNYYNGNGWVLVSFFRGGCVVPLFLEIHLLKTSLGHIGSKLFPHGCVEGEGRLLLQAGWTGL